MATRFHITESSDGLRALVQHDMRSWERILTAGVAGACMGLASSYFLPGHWWVIVFSVVLIASFAASLQRKHVELRITKVEFFTRGNYGMKFRLGQAVCASDVRWLEFHGGSGSEIPEEGQGLYAVTTQGNACLLPYVTEQDAAQLIQEIEKKFPSMAERWRLESAYGNNFLSLGIRGSR